MKSQVKTILQELYKTDPSLKEKEASLVKIIEQLIKARPDFSADSGFKETLRAEIMQKAKEIKELNRGASPVNSGFGWRLALKPAFAGLAGILFVVLIAWPFLNKKGGFQLDNVFAFQEVGEQDSFGDLALGKNEAIEDVDVKGLRQEQGQSGEQAQTLLADEAEALPPAKASQDNRGVNYTFVYQGGDFTIKEEKAEVLKRVADEKSAEVLAEHFEKLEIDEVEIGASLEVSNYQVNIDFQDGEIWISQQVVVSTIQAEKAAGFEASGSVTEEEAIEIADRFINGYVVDLSSYDQPEASLTGNIAVVVYPLKIKGKQVYNLDGKKVGIHCQIDPVRKEVVGLQGLRTLTYQKALYDVERNSQKILEQAEKQLEQFNFDFPSTTTPLYFQTPVPVFVNIIREQKGRAEEFLVPALIFQIATSTEQSIYQQNIIVPVVK